MAKRIARPSTEWGHTSVKLAVIREKAREIVQRLRHMPERISQEIVTGTRLWISERRQRAAIRVARRSARKALTRRDYEFPDIKNEKYEITAQGAGQDDAISSRPHPESTLLPPVVVSIQNELRNIYGQGVKSCQSLFESIETKVDTLLMRFSGVTLEAQANQVRDEMSVALTFSPYAESISFHYKEFVRRHADLQRFRVQHDLVYEPIRGGHGTGKHLVFVISLYVVESFFNAALFINVIGLLGGLTISLSTSAINVIMGYIVGRFLVSATFFHPDVRLKLLSFIGALSFLAFILYLNFALAVFRSLQEKASSAFEEINTGLAIMPFSHLDVMSFESALVIAVGLLFAIAALLDGYFSDDPFPGYGSKWRLCIAERSIIQYEFKQYQREFNEETRKARKKTEEMFATAQKAINEWSKEINKVQHYFVDFEQWADKINDTYSACWEIYAATHQNHRPENYSPPKTLATKPENLLDDDQIDPLYVFAGAANCYMEDQERQKKAAEFEKDFLEKYLKAEEDLEKTIIVLTNTLAELEITAQCNI